jgi:uncharacterized protein (DUF169 family)
MNLSYSELADRLTVALNLSQPPVSICMADALPAGIPRFEGRVAAGCRFWQEASERVFSTSAHDHDLCAIGIYTHHLSPSPEQQIDLQDALRIFGELGYVRPEDIPQIPVLAGSPEYVVYGPLAKTPMDPDMVLLFVDAARTLILSEATQQIESSLPPAMGRPACAVVPQVLNTGRAALSLGCCGARAYLDVLSDEVAIFGIPGAKLEIYVERIESLAIANTTLTTFHQLRRLDVEAGNSPSIKQSLTALSAN